MWYDPGFGFCRPSLMIDSCIANTEAGFEMGCVEAFSWVKIAESGTERTNCNCPRIGERCIRIDTSPIQIIGCGRSRPRAWISREHSTPITVAVNFVETSRSACLSYQDP